MPLNYTTGKIYAIRSHSTDKIYIGSTIRTLSQRMSGHKANYKQFLKTQDKYMSSFELLKYDDCYIELIKNYPCNSKEELDREEGIEIRANDCVNKYIAGRTKVEWIQDNIEKSRLIKMKYRNNNKEKLQISGKIYRENNRQKINEKTEKWKKIKKECKNCNITLTNGSWAAHIKTKKHFDNAQDKVVITTIGGEHIKRLIYVYCKFCSIEILKTGFSKHEKSKRHQENLKNYEESESEEEEEEESESEEESEEESESESDESSVDQTESSNDSDSSSSSQ